MKSVRDFRKGSRQDLTLEQIKDRIRLAQHYDLQLIAERAEVRCIIEGLNEEIARRNGLTKIKKDVVE